MMMNKVVVSLQKEYSRLEKEMGQVGKALDALGHSGGKKLKLTGRTLSKDAADELPKHKSYAGPRSESRRQASQDVSDVSTVMLRKHRSRPRS